MPRSIPRNAGIGVFIINTQVQPPQQVYIKATMKDFTSVLMAEAAALALATTVCS
jgi:putative N-acetylmannosamine-6-phosphate epimerase